LAALLPEGLVVQTRIQIDNLATTNVGAMGKDKTALTLTDKQGSRVLVEMPNADFMRFAEKMAGYWTGPKRGNEQ
jgi:hypothetical protein